MGMSLFEKYLGRTVEERDKTFEREWYVAKLYSKSHMRKRWKEIGFKLPTVEQLKLEL